MGQHEKEDHHKIVDFEKLEGCAEPNKNSTTCCDADLISQFT